MKQSDKDREGSEEVQGHRAKTCKPSQQFLSLTGISLQRPLYLSSSPNSEGILGSGVAGRRIEGKEYFCFRKSSRIIFPGKNKVCIQASENTGYFTTQDVLKVLAFLSHSKTVFCITETP